MSRFSGSIIARKKENPVNDSDRFSMLCEQIVGKRFTYAQFTAKEDKKQEKSLSRFRLSTAWSEAEGG